MTTKLYVRAPSGRLGIQVVDSDASSARSAVSKVNALWVFGSSFDQLSHFELTDTGER